MRRLWGLDGATCAVISARSRSDNRIVQGIGALPGRWNERRVCSPQCEETNRLPELGSVSREVSMLYTIAVIPLIVWLLGLVSSYAAAGYPAAASARNVT